jgi:hypothetical protein
MASRLGSDGPKGYQRGQKGVCYMWMTKRDEHLSALFCNFMWRKKKKAEMRNSGRFSFLLSSLIAITDKITVNK